jgi:hypothetical protein
MERQHPADSHAPKILSKPLAPCPSSGSLTPKTALWPAIAKLCINEWTWRFPGGLISLLMRF